MYRDYIGTVGRGFYIKILYSYLSTLRLRIYRLVKFGLWMTHGCSIDDDDDDKDTPVGEVQDTKFSSRPKNLHLYLSRLYSDFLVHTL